MGTPPVVINPKESVLQAVFLTDSSGTPLSGLQYETVAASQTDQVLSGGGGGAAGDVLNSMLVTPATTSPGAISIKDGGGSAVTLFTGGASSVADLKPFTIVINQKSVNGPWKVTTGANVSLVAQGSFT